MCGRYTLKTDPKVLAMDFNVAAVALNDGVLANFSSQIVPVTQLNSQATHPNFNVAPTHMIPAVALCDGVNTLAAFSWGLVPAWAKDPSIGSRMINARVETVTEKPSFRSAIAKRRCIIPADGWYEWQKVGSAKQPFYFSAADESPVGFAGIYEQWTAADDTVLWSVALITRDAAPHLAHIHDRMPLLVAPHLREDWLAPGSPPLNQVIAQADQAADVRAWAVSTQVGNVRNNYPQLTEPLPIQQEL